MGVCATGVIAEAAKPSRRASHQIGPALTTEPETTITSGSMRLPMPPTHSPSARALSVSVRRAPPPPPPPRFCSDLPTCEKDPPFASLSAPSMASPHAAGVAALIKQIHPDYTADQVIALMKKQANENFDRLAEPTDGKEYRGAGLVNALAAVLKDQPRPVLGTIQDSYDGATDWRPLADAHLAGTIYVRATVSGPLFPPGGLPAVAGGRGHRESDD